MRLSGAQIIIKTLSALGTDTVFGYPGGWVVGVYDALYRSRRIRHILTCHEQAAAHAADGYARKSGRVGVVLATSGPGGTNLVTGVAAAYMDSVPMLVLTCGVPPAIFGKDNFQEIDLFGLSMPITKHNFLVKDIKDIEPTIRRACAIAAGGRPGPVWVDIHADLAEKARYLGAGEAETQRPILPDSSRLDAVAELINTAQRPVILAGGGVAIARAQKQLERFAEKCGLPVCLTSRALGTLPDSNPLCLGLLGMHGGAAAAKAVAECDLLIAVGTRFSDRTVGRKSGFAPGAKVIHIDIDAAEIGKNISADIGIEADVRDTLTALYGRVERKSRKKWLEQLQSVKKAAECPGSGANPGVVLAAMQAALPDATLATDVGQHQIWVWQYCDFSAPDKLLTSCGLGAMGYGMGAAIGAKLAAESERVALVTGDGSFHMNMAELATAVTLKLPLVILVLDNRALGMVRQWQTLYYDGRYSQTEPARRTDYVRLARAMGASGMELDTDGDMVQQFSAAARLADKRRRPVVIHCKIEPDRMVMPMIKPSAEDAAAKLINQQGV